MTIYLFVFNYLTFISFSLIRKLLWSSMHSVQFICSVVSNSLRPHESQHARPPCPSPSPGVHSASCPSSQWCHPAILSSVVPFSSCPQSLPASESFPMNNQDWFPLGLTGLISLQSRGPSRVFSNTTVQKHQFFSPQLSHIHT